MNGIGWGYRLRIAPKLSRWTIVVFMALAPLVCVFFCNAKHAVEQTKLNQDTHFLHHLHQSEPSSNHDHAPLSDLQQMIASMTEFLPWANIWTVLIVMVVLTVPRMLTTCSAQLSPPIPPPRLGLRR